MTIHDDMGKRLKNNYETVPKPTSYHSTSYQCKISAEIWLYYDKQFKNHIYFVNYKDYVLKNFYRRINNLFNNW